MINLILNYYVRVDSIFLLVSDGDGKVIAFLMFQFTWDDEDEPEYPVVYVYELQVNADYRRHKIGKTLMRVCRDIGQHWRMEKLVILYCDGVIV